MLKKLSSKTAILLLVISFMVSLLPLISTSANAEVYTSYSNPIPSYPNRGGYIGFLYNRGNNVLHLGCDFKADVTTTVKAVLDGEVVYSAEVSGYGGKSPTVSGGAIVIKHVNKNGQPFYALYGHVNRLVSVGDKVKREQPIGTIRTYIDSGVEMDHLHFGINTVRSSYSGYSDVYNYPLSDWTDPTTYLSNYCTNMTAPSPSVPSLNSPTDNTTIQSGAAATFSWSDTGAARYRVRFTNSTGAGSIDINVNGTSVPFTPNYSGNWSWKVCVFPDSGIEGSYSAERHFTVPGSSSSAPSPPPSSSTSGSVHVDYYNNIQLSGSPVYSANISDININWGSGGPGSGVWNDNFSARFTQQAYFSGGWYKFHYEVDDAIKIWVDGDCKVDKWGSHVLNQDSPAINIPAGNHQIAVDYADYGGDAKIYVTWSGTAAPEESKADLSPTSITCDSAGIGIGKPLVLDSGIQNSGAADSGVFAVKWYMNGSEAYSGAHASVPAGMTMMNGNSAYSWTPDAAGTYTFTFVVDADNQVSESNEGNNVTSVTVTVPEKSLPDLSTSGIKLGSGDLEAGHQVLVYSGISNTGSAGAGAFHFRWYVSGVQAAYGTHDAIPANTTVSNGSCAFNWTPAASGTYTIKLVVDSDNQIEESSESNNETAMTVTVSDADQLDLMPTVITYSSSGIAIGKTLLLNSGISNTGRADSEGFYVRWLVNGAQVGYSYHPGLSAGATVKDGNSTYAWTPTAAGVYTFTFAVDPDNAVKESNEGNNVTTVTVTVPEDVTSSGDTAAPTSSTVLINGRNVVFEAYLIGSNNYFKLRDLAYALSGTANQFNVGWSGAANAILLSSGYSYVPVGGELSVSGGTALREAVPSSARVFMDGREISLAAYTIGGYNYFKLRDLAAAINVGVTWNGATNTIEITTSDWSPSGSGDTGIPTVRYQTSWTTRGDAEELAADSGGNIYVTDPANSSIKKYSKDGVFITSWGSLGTGDGQFGSSICGIAVDAQGSVYVSDSLNNRIQKFTSDGTFLAKGYGRLNYPKGLAVDSHGYIYAVSEWNNTIQKFSPELSLVKTWGSYGSADGCFDYPDDIAIDSSDNVYVVDDRDGSKYGNCVQKFTTDGSFIAKWGTYGSGDGQFNSAWGIAVDRQNRVFVTDTKNNRIVVYSASGEFISNYGNYGSGSSQFDAPNDIIVTSDGLIYISEINNGHRIQVFSH